MPSLLGLTTNAKKYFTYVLVCILILTLQQMHVYVTLTKNHDTLNGVAQSHGKVETFIWQDYLDLNPDLRTNGVASEKQATNHYLRKGKEEGRLCVRKRPTKGMLSSSRNIWSDNLSTRGRVLVIYHINKITYMNSWDVLSNNVQIFCSMLTKRSKKYNSETVFLFSVIGGKENPLSKYIPRDAPNVLVYDWEDGDTNTLESQMRLVDLLGEEEVSKYDRVLFLNDLTRGPLTMREDLKWLTSFLSLFVSSSSLVNSGVVGLVTSVTQCANGLPQLWSDTTPFALSGSLSFKVAREMLDPIHRSYLTRLHTVTEVVLRLGFDVSTVYHQSNILRGVVKSDVCAQSTAGFSASQPDGPSAASLEHYCGVRPQEAVILPWGGERFNQPGYVCSEMRREMRQTLETLQAELKPEAVNLILPETVQGGLMHDLYQQFEQEVYRSHHSHTLSSAVSDNSRVCFLVRTSTMHDSQGRVASLDYHEGLVGLIQSLIGQVNPHWAAYFFVTDDQPFDARLEELLSSYHDSRLKYVNIDPTPRLKFTKTDAGYTATDHVLRYVNTKCPECRWISVTNGDNAYGSEVVENVLKVNTNRESNSVRGKSEDGLSTGEKTPSMLLSPIDSRNFAEQEVGPGLYRSESYDVFQPAGLHNSTLPVMGRVDLAAVFLLRSKLAEENLYFGNFTNPDRYPCLGCQDGYLTEYLVRNREWHYVRLPIDGLKSIVFHGPSPTLCIASGNVWFDHPNVNKVECYTQERIAELRREYEKSSSPLYDWKNFMYSSGMCVRLTKKAYAEAK